MALFDNRGFGGFGQEQYRPESKPVVEEPVVEEPVSEPVVEDSAVERAVEPKPAAKPKAKPKNKKRGPDAKSVNLTLAARDRLDEDVRRVLAALTGHDDDARLVLDVLDKVAARPAALLLEAADAADDVSRAILLMQKGEKDNSALRAAARLAESVNPDLAGRFATTNQPALVGALAQTVGLLDRSVLESLR